MTGADQTFSLEAYATRVANIDPVPSSGRVVRTVGLLIESSGPHVCVGSMCEVVGSDGRRLPVQVVLEWAKLARAEILRGC